jgi:hypothetical protein
MSYLAKCTDEFQLQCQSDMYVKGQSQWMIRMLRVSREGVEVEESRGRIEIYVNFSYFEYMAIFIDIDLY